MRPERSAEPIEDYLDDLLLNLRLPPRDTRGLLAETESHLQEEAASWRGRGVAAVAAEEEAVRRFGSAKEVAAAAGSARRPSGVVLLVQAAQAALALAGLGLAAVGISGALAALANALAGPHLVGALPEAYPAPTCAGYLAAHPAAASCAQAAMWENSHDTVTLRLLAGMLGLAVLAGTWLWRKAASRDGTLAKIRDGATAALAAAAFTVAAAFLLGNALDLAVQHGSGGTGFYLTGGVTAAAGGAISAYFSRRWLRHLRPWRLAPEHLLA